MSNTLKFGNGEWATKDGSALAYNDENNNFKPLPFDFTRASSATVINRDGLIEKVGNNIPRIDFQDNTEGAMLLEPQSTNLITQSEAFGKSYWTKSGASIEGDASTAGAEKVVNGDFSSGANWTILSGTTISGGVANINQSGTVQLMHNSLSVTANTFYKVSFEIKNYVSGTCAMSFAGYGFQIAATSNGVFTAYANSFANGPLFIYSSSGFVGSIDNVSVKEVQGFSAPSVDSPLGAFKLVEDTSTGLHYCITTAPVVSGTSYTYSIIAKYSGSYLQLSSSTAFPLSHINYDLQNGTTVTGSGAATGTIEALSNGYYRCTYTDVANATSSGGLIIPLLTNSPTATKNHSYTGDGTSGVYLFGAQLEALAYPTSYIKTEGSTVTRLSDSCNNGGNDQVINSTEGVLYFEGSALANDNTFRLLSISDGTSNNEVKIQFSTTDNRIGAGINVGGVSQCDIFKDSIDILSINKVAFSYSLNKFELWINGVKEAEDLSGSVFSLNTLNKLSFSRGNDTLNFISNTKDLRVYNTALTDAELIALTR